MDDDLTQERIDVDVSEQREKADVEKDMKIRETTKARQELDHEYDGLDDDIHTKNQGALRKYLVRTSHLAKEELMEFAKARKPPSIPFTRMAVFLVFQWFFKIFHWRKKRGEEHVGFFTALARLGGIEKVNTLLVISRFDADRSETIDEHEYQQYERMGGQLVDDCIAGCGNTAVIATLMIGAAHANNIGRPIPWVPSGPVIDYVGMDGADAILWLAYGFNVLLELGAVFLLLLVTFSRVLLVYVLPSTGTKINFIVQSNLPGTMSSCIVGLTLCIMSVVGWGGVLAHPELGIFALIVAPIIGASIFIYLSRYWYEATLVLHKQAQRMCGLSEYPRSLTRARNPNRHRIGPASV